MLLPRVPFLAFVQFLSVGCMFGMAARIVHRTVAISILLVFCYRHNYLCVSVIVAVPMRVIVTLL